MVNLQFNGFGAFGKVPRINEYMKDEHLPM